jgi:hypothetical protein
MITMSKMKTRTAARARRPRMPDFCIYGFVPGSDQVLCAMPRGHSEAARSLEQLLKNSKVSFVEVLRFGRWTDTEEEIRNAVGK